MSIKSINPATGETIAEYGWHTEAEIDTILERVDAGAAHWRYASFAKRARGLRDLAVALREQAPDLAALMAREMGKPIPQGEAEVEKCAWVCDYYAELVNVCCGRSTSPPTPTAARSRSSPSARSCSSCLGIFPSGKCSGSRHRL
jgi:acyl-CoA reductase-like NAD-dependent aldehyde dehydrogenase